VWVRSLLARLRRFVRKLAAEHGSPSRLFAACVIGGMIGSTPFFGLHLPICIGAALLFRLNKVAVYGAANISIPPIAPFLAFACIQVGTRVLTGHGQPMSIAVLRATPPWSLARDVFFAWLAGAPLVGGAIGAMLGSVVFAIARAREKRKHQGPIGFAFEELEARFADAPMGIRQYVHWKTRLDPVYRAIADELPDRVHLVELGTGLGILPILLSLLGLHRRVTGIDHDEKKIAEGKRASKGLAVSLEVGDARTVEIPPCDAIAIVDVLHYFDDDTQRTLLQRVHRALPLGGVLFVRETDADQNRSSTTRALEWLAVKLGWNRSEERPHFRPLRALTGDLEAIGFSVATSDASGRLHPGNALIVARKAR